MPRPALPSTSCRTARRPSASTTACAAPWRPRLGGLTLLSPDPAKRIAAAQSVFKSHEETALPVIDGALAKETNKAAKAGLYRGARRHPAVQVRTLPTIDKLGGRRRHQGARRSGSAWRC